MAKVNGNIFMEHLSGMIGDQLVLKRARGGGTIISKKPTFRPDRAFSTAQLAQQQAFREATAYGRAMKREPIYLAKANGSAQTGYNVAVADWFNRPEILEIDLSGWTARQQWGHPHQSARRRQSAAGEGGYQRQEWHAPGRRPGQRKRRPVVGVPHRPARHRGPARDCRRTRPARARHRTDRSERHLGMM